MSRKFNALDVVSEIVEETQAMVYLPGAAQPEAQQRSGCHKRAASVMGSVCFICCVQDSASYHPCTLLLGS